jgi:hypothetical protein
MHATGAIVQRLYRNAADEIIAIDTISVGGVIERANVFQMVHPDAVNGIRQWGDWKFLQDGPITVARELIHLSADRTVAEIEFMGAVSDYDAVNFDWFEFVPDPQVDAVRIDLSGLSDIGDVI